MYAQNTGLSIVIRFRTITNWGFAGVILVGFPAYLRLDEDRAPAFMTLGFVSFMVVRGFLFLREDRETAQGF